jgi:AhpD family alkylhydroperoxidase
MENVAADVKHYRAQAEKTMEQVEKASPAFYEAYMNFSQQAGKAGALSTKVKELVCLAIGITVHCTFCIAAHAKKAIDAGASREEIMETGFVAVKMGGGPSLAYLRYVIDACDQFGAK